MELGLGRGLSSRFDVIWELKDKEAVNELLFLSWGMLVVMQLGYGSTSPAQPCGLSKAAADGIRGQGAEVPRLFPPGKGMNPCVPQSVTLVKEGTYSPLVQYQYGGTSRGVGHLGHLEGLWFLEVTGDRT